MSDHSHLLVEDLRILLPSLEAYQSELQNYHNDDEYRAILEDVVKAHDEEFAHGKLLLPFYADDIKSRVIFHMETLKAYEKEFALLTPQEEEILKYLAEECSRKQIAAALNCSEGTIKKHCEHIYKKLGTNSRVIIRDIVAAFLEV